MLIQEFLNWIYEPNNALDELHLEREFNFSLEGVNFQARIELNVEKKHLGEGARDVNLKDKSGYVVPVLTFSGVLNEVTKSGFCQVASGQCAETIREFASNACDFAERDELLEMLALWQNWHLNNLRAGTAWQNASLKTKQARMRIVEIMAVEDREICYNEAASRYLKEIGLYEDRGYYYGYIWLYAPISTAVFDDLSELFGEGEVKEYCAA